MYKIKDDIYDFDIRKNEGWSFRNIATGIAGMFHGLVYDNFMFVPTPTRSFIPISKTGFPIRFKGAVYIKP